MVKFRWNARIPADHDGWISCDGLKLKRDFRLTVQRWFGHSVLWNSTVRSCLSQRMPCLRRWFSPAFWSRSLTSGRSGRSLLSQSVCHRNIEDSLEP